jgi:hypothetical protein
LRSRSSAFPGFQANLEKVTTPIPYFLIVPRSKLVRVGAWAHHANCVLANTFAKSDSVSLFAIAFIIPRYNKHPFAGRVSGEPVDTQFLQINIEQGTKIYQVVSLASSQKVVCRKVAG